MSADRGAAFDIPTPALSRGTADRSEGLRNADRAVAGWPSARVLLLDDDGAAPMGAQTPDGRPNLLTRPAAEVAGKPPGSSWLLGSVNGIDCWAMPEQAVRGSAAGRDTAGGVPAGADGRADGGAERRTLRQVGALLSDTDAGLFTVATALHNWHRTTRFCARCGEPTEPSTAGWSRMCPAGHQEFPRLDPAVIVLVHDGGEHIVLARQPVWPAGRVSVLAGFVEAGESLEGTVLREISEEIGVQVSEPQYLGSQPWPFPRSLMVGFAARADRHAPLLPQDGEIEHARWVPRDEVRQILAAGGSLHGTSLPDEVSIARRMIKGWADRQF